LQDNPCHCYELTVGDGSAIWECSHWRFRVFWWASNRKGKCFIYIVDEVYVRFTQSQTEFGICRNSFVSRQSMFGNGKITLTLRSKGRCDSLFPHHFGQQLCCENPC
jgi:hypothetical protein